MDHEAVEAIIRANRDRIEVSIREGEAELASGDPLKSLDELVESGDV